MLQRNSESDADIFDSDCVPVVEADVLDDCRF